jgi:hypothetical protein
MAACNQMIEHFMKGASSWTHPMNMRDIFLYHEQDPQGDISSLSTPSIPNGFQYIYLIDYQRPGGYFDGVPRAVLHAR